MRWPSRRDAPLDPARPLTICVLTTCVLATAAILAVDGATHVMLAQTPFGGPRPSAEPQLSSQVGGVVGWLLSKQSEFYREISSAIRAAKTDGHAVWTLLAISFAYGLFRAARPRCAPARSTSARYRR